MFRSLLLPAGPSVPNPRRTPPLNIDCTGATPLASIMLLLGLCTHPVCDFPRSAMSLASQPTAESSHGFSKGHPDRRRPPGHGNTNGHTPSSAWVELGKTIGVNRAGLVGRSIRRRSPFLQLRPTIGYYQFVAGADLRFMMES